MKLIASAFRKELSLLDNYINHQEMLSFLTDAGIDFEVGVGSWEGEQELCFVIFDVDHNATLTRLLNMFMFDYKQDAYLLIEDNNPNWIHVTAWEALRKEAFTYVSGNYYIYTGQALYSE